LDDWTTVTRAKTIDSAVDDYDTIIKVATALLRDYGPQRPVRLIGVGVTGFTSPTDESQLMLPFELPAA
jgi:DNA polymerase-4